MSVENQWLFNVEDLENVPSVKSGAMNQVQEIAARREVEHLKLKDIKSYWSLIIYFHTAISML